MNNGFMPADSATAVPRRGVPEDRWMIRVACGFLVSASVALAGVSTFAQTTAPTPESVIGWPPCADYKLATYEQIEDYFRKLAIAVPSRMQLIEMGKTAEGRTQVLAVVSSEQNLRQLGKYKDIARRLALARASTSRVRPEPADGQNDGDRLTDGEARAMSLYLPSWRRFCSEETTASTCVRPSAVFPISMSC